MEDKKLQQYLEEKGKNVGIEEVRKITSKIKGSLSEEIIKERHGKA